MTEKAASQDRTTTEGASPEKRPYSTPALARYGELFVETTTSTCSDLHSDGGTDMCDNDKDPVNHIDGF